MGLMQALRRSRFVTQVTQVQPQQATVEKTWNKAGSVSRQPGYRQGVSLHATMDRLSAPAWGATTPTAFIQIQGQLPKTPVVGQVATIAGSNAPTGGAY